MSWENMPSHICRGGDLRGLTFCCPPVKPCPLLNALHEAGLSPQEYVDIKTKFAKETRLGEGPGTCFGSLVWCCKPTKPCPLRDMSMRNINMSVEEYTNLKKQLSEELVAKSKVKNTDDENPRSNGSGDFFFLYQKLRRPAAAFSMSVLYFFCASICFWASLPACTSAFVHGTILHITMYRASS